ncbi:hypothetical protein M8J76_012779 [Diaphorina citri]|nr:hypothetical protein M8J76_012779 [Diaphorina citri]
MVHKCWELVSKLAPVFPARSDQIRLLSQPNEFYSELIQHIQNAKSRIIITSLYMGTGSLEQKLVHTLQDTLTNNKAVNVRILLDANRGTRGDVNSKTLLSPIVKQFSHNCHVSFYHTPDLRWPLNRLLPHRYNELIGLQHMKFYLIDNCVIITGANLSSDYFTSRQDRYMIIQDHKPLSDFFDDLSRVLSLSSTQPPDTWLAPLIELPPLHIQLDSRVTKLILSLARDGSCVSLGTGYFNLTQEYVRAMLDKPRVNYSVLMAHPTANGFLGARGAAGGIPYAYTALAARFLSRVSNLKVAMFEYVRSGWTYHAKGLWYSESPGSKPVLTLIGSPNFGERSLRRDLECSLLLVSREDSVHTALENERSSLFESSTPFTLDIAQSEDRKSPLWVRAVLALFRYYF